MWKEFIDTRKASTGPLASFPSIWIKSPAGWEIEAFIMELKLGHSFQPEGFLWYECFSSHIVCEVKVSVAQSCSFLCDPMDYSPPDSYVHAILQARILEWIAVPFSRGSSQPRDPTRFPTLQVGSLLSEPLVQFSHSVMSDSVTPWTAAHQDFLSITNSQSLFRLMSIM